MKFDQPTTQWLKTKTKTQRSQTGKHLDLKHASTTRKTPPRSKTQKIRIKPGLEAKSLEILRSLMKLEREMEMFCWPHHKREIVCFKIERERKRELGFSSKV